MRRGTQGHVARPREPTRAPAWHKGSADVWQGHASPRGHPGGATWRERVTGLANEGPTGYWALVRILGRKRKCVTPFPLLYLIFSIFFSVWDYVPFFSFLFRTHGAT